MIKVFLTEKDTHALPSTFIAVNGHVFLNWTISFIISNKNIRISQVIEAPVSTTLALSAFVHRKTNPTLSSLSFQRSALKSWLI